jgi:hypothetical protein
VSCPRRIRSALLGLLLATLTAGCGAGVIGAALLGSRDRDDPPPPASITLSQPFGPLSIDVDEFYVRRAVLRNVSIAADADLEVAIVAVVGGLEVEDPQSLLLVERAVGEVSVGFALRTDAIVAAVGDPTAADLAAEVRVAARSEGRVQLFRAVFQLFRKPTLDLVPNDPQLGASLVSVFGDELELSVAGLPTDDARDLTVEIVTGDPNPPGGEPAALLRRATNVRAEPDAQDPERTSVRCTVPSSTFPTQAFVRVAHAQAGRSTVVAQVYYRPELTAVVSRRGGADGGDLVSLTGQGLVPFDFGTVPPRPAFTALQLFFDKGGREAAIGAADLRPTLSSPNSIVFVTPPSPDGRSGPVTVRLRVVLPVAVDVERDGLFAYGAREADLGPRGFSLDPGTVAAAFGGRSAQSGPEVPVDAAVVAPDASGVPVVRLLESLGNGTFAQLGPAVRAGDRGDLDQRFPLDLIWGAFRDDPWRDLVVVNRGTIRSAHTVLRGREDPAEPLRFGGAGFRSEVAPRRAHRGAFDDDPRDDLLVVGGLDAERTSEYATASAAGVFTTRRVFTEPVPRVDASAVADVDGDGFADHLFASGGTGAGLRIHFGESGPLFGDRRFHDLSAIPTLVSGEVVGLHAPGPGPLAELVLVVRDLGGAEPALVVLPPDAPRVYGGTHGLIPLGPTGGDPTRSLGADLDGDGVEELLLARETGGLSLWVREAGGLVLRPGAVGLAPASTGAVLDLDAGPAVDPALGARPAVFVAHQAPALPGPRLTVLLVGPGPTLVDPSAVRPLADPPRAAVLGSFAGGGTVGQDLVLAVRDRLDVLRNDGVGGFSGDEPVGAAGIVAETMVGFASAPGGGRDAVAFVFADGRVGVWDATLGLRIGPAPLFDGAGTVTAASRLAVADVDADGREDLAILLAVERPPLGQIDRWLLFLRGREALSTALPFVLPQPTARTVLVSLAVDLALGQLAPRSGDRWLEAAVAVGRADEGGRGIQFFRLDPGTGAGDGRFVLSVVEPGDGRVAAGLDPALVRIADLDADGLDDLLVVSSSLDVVQVIRQSRLSIRAPDSGEVDPQVFAFSAERALPAGSPQAAHLADFDGDGLADLVVRVRSRFAADRFALVLAISNGLGGFANVALVPEPFVGSAGLGSTSTVGDANGDGIPDLALGWSGDGGAIPPQLRLLFGTQR